MFHEKVESKSRYGHPDITSMFVSSSIVTAFLNNGNSIAVKMDYFNEPKYCFRNFKDINGECEDEIIRKPENDYEKTICDIVLKKLVNARIIYKNHNR